MKLKRNFKRALYAVQYKAAWGEHTMWIYGLELRCMNDDAARRLDASHLAYYPLVDNRLKGLCNGN